MANFIIKLDKDKQFYVSGLDAAWEAFKSAADFASILGVSAKLIDAETNEVIDYFEVDI